MKKNVVSSFDVDHRTLDAGLYLRSVYTINEEFAVRSWDLRDREQTAVKKLRWLLVAVGNYPTQLTMLVAPRCAKRDDD